MKRNLQPRNGRFAGGLLLGLALLLVWVASPRQTAVEAQATDRPRVNVPYTSATEASGIPQAEAAVFWFGDVGPTTDNYVDARVIHNDDKLHVTLHVFDRLLYYKRNPTAAEMPDWDAATLYIDTDAAPGTAPDASSHRFVGQVSWNEDRSSGAYHAAYQGAGGGWQSASTAIDTRTGWQGQGFNNQVEDDGWNIIFRVPYDSLGLSGRPPAGAQWRIAVVLHDNDGGGAIADKQWPPSLDTDNPTTWANLHFGLPAYTPPSGTTAENSVTIRHGLNGATVKDVHAGGSSTCANELWPNFWPQWGSVNRAGSTFLNVQNQWNLGDWPCFSKVYMTFPLDQVPANTAVVDATLTMTHFGNSNQDLSFPDPPQDSIVQVLVINDDWQENTLTWNNAPLAMENVARATVPPLPPGPPFVNVPRQWDLSYAVAEALAAGKTELRLVIYSADTPKHSGKYFRASEAGTAAYRPTLEITYGSASGIDLAANPLLTAIAPGGSAQYRVDVTALGSFSGSVSLSAGNPAPGELSISDTPASLTPPGFFTVTVDHQNGGFSGSRLYAVPLTVSGGGEQAQVTVYLAVNPQQVFLPLVTR